MNNAQLDRQGLEYPRHILDLQTGYRCPFEFCICGCCKEAVCCDAYVRKGGYTQLASMRLLRRCLSQLHGVRLWRKRLAARCRCQHESFEMLAWQWAGITTPNPAKLNVKAMLDIFMMASA